MRPYSPGGLLNALAAAQQDWVPATPSNHRLGLGLPGYLILFAPLAFVPQRQLWSSEPLSPQVFLLISTHFTLHQEFHSPLPYSSTAVSLADSELSPEISQKTYRTAYAPFTPNNSEQRLPPLYYRGCWHRVSRGFFHRYRHYRPGRKEFTSQGTSSSTLLLHQGFPHCAKFPTAASRRSLDRVSVPVCPCALSGRILIIALVGHYPTN